VRKCCPAPRFFTYRQTLMPVRSAAFSSISDAADDLFRPLRVLVLSHSGSPMSVTIHFGVNARTAVESSCDTLCEEEFSCTGVSVNSSTPIPALKSFRRWSGNSCNHALP
jgi:hypothetical protein